LDCETALKDAAPMAVREMNTSSTITRDNSRREPLSTIQINRNSTTAFADLVKSVRTDSKISKLAILPRITD
jgi:hypothetical protein